MNKICRLILGNSFIANTSVLLNARHLNCMSFSRASPLLNASSLIALNRKSDSFCPTTNQIRSYQRKFDYKPKFESGSSHLPNRRKFDSKSSGRNINAKLWDEDLDEAQPVESTSKADYTTENKLTFRDFDIPEELVNRLEKLGYSTPFEIQEKTLKTTLDGKDLVGKAFTGSGKTLAFAIPIISRIMKSENVTGRYPKCLVLSPTRELCLQLTDTIQKLSPNLKCISIVGGTGYEAQISQLNKKVDIVCATPGRLRDLMNRKNFIPDDIETICLDEADELLNPNFLEQIKDVIELTNKKQILMFSATLSKNVHHLINMYMKNPVFVDLTKGKTQKLPSNIEHYVMEAPRRSHVDLIVHCLEKFQSERCIVFTNMKREAIKFVYELSREGVQARDLHSDLSQTKRQLVLESFRKGRTSVLVATDVASRGIDIPEVDLIIQIESPPNGLDFYIHRSGRTGRAGRSGKSILIHSGTGDNLIRSLSRLVTMKQIEMPETIKTQIKSRNNEMKNEDDENDQHFDRMPTRSRFDQDDDRKIFRTNKRIFGSTNRHNDVRYSNFKSKLTNRFEPKNDVDLA